MPSLETDIYRTLTVAKEPEPTLESGIWPGEKVAFACWANHGRSQMAEAIFRANFPTVDVVSGGSILRPDKYEDNMPNPLVVEVLREHGLETSGLRVKQLSRKDITKGTDLFLFVPHNLFKGEIINATRSSVDIPVEDPSVVLNVWGKQPPIDKLKIVESFMLMKDLIENRLRNITLDVRTLERELAEKHIHYPVSKLYRVSGDTISRVRSTIY